MPTYAFAADVGQFSNAQFAEAVGSFRSDVEQRNSPLAIQNPDSADLEMARKLADEMINVSGAEVQIFIRTDNADFDKVWDEDPNPTYWNKVLIKGYFKPAPLEAELKKWGADIENKMEIVFSHAQIFTLFNTRMLRVGDVIKVPYNAATSSNPKNYRITNPFPSGNFRYNWLYLTCQVELLTADMTVRPENDITPTVEDEVAGGYRESL